MTKKPLYEELEQKVSNLEREVFEARQAADKTRAAETEKKAILNAMSDIVMFQDTDLSIRWGNEAAGRSVGKTPQDLVGRHCYDLWNDRMKPCKGCPVLSGLEKGSPVSRIAMTPDGRWWEIKVEPVRNRNGKINGAIEIARDITEQKQAETALLEREKKLERQAQHLEEVNTALNVLLEHREKEKTTLEENILSNVQRLIFPYLEKVERSQLDDKNQTYIDIIKSNLNELISPFAKTLSSKYAILTSTEIQVADHIKHGRTSKEIASLMNVSIKAVSFHRSNIRRKLGLAKKKINLRSHLQSLAT